VAGQSAELLADTAVTFHGVQEFMTQERMIVLDQMIPLFGRNLLDPFMDADFQA
jgi:hypothetical protein